MLKNSPRAFDILRRISPVPFCVQVAEEQFRLQAVFNRGDSTRDFARNERFATARALVVEHNAIGREKAVALAVVDRRPI